MLVRKQVYDLTPHDLTANAVWEFALDEEGDEAQDEATVRPFAVDGVVDPSDGMFVVRATFRLNDGSTRNGYLTPPSLGDASLGIVQPVVVTGGGQVSFWLGISAPTSEQLAEDYARLQSDAASSFPIRYQSDLPSVHGPISGTIEGFYVVEDISSGRAGVIR